MRSLADGENLRKRTLKDIENSKKYSHISFVKDLITSVDNFQRALKAVPEDKSSLPEPIQNLIIGLEIVEKEICATLEKHNVKLIDPLGEKLIITFIKLCSKFLQMRKSQAKSLKFLKKVMCCTID